MAVNQNPSQQSVQNSQQIVDNTDKLKESLKEVLFLQRDFAEEAKKAAKAVFESNIQASATYKSFKDLADATKDISVSYSDIITGQKTLRELQKDIEKQDKARKSLLIETQQALAKSGATQEQINDALSKQGGIADYINGNFASLTAEQVELLDLYKEQLSALDGQSKDLSEIQKRAKVINDAFGTLGNTVEGIEKGLNKAGFGNLTSRLGLSEAAKKTREYTAEITKGGTKASTIGDKFKIAGELAKNVGGNLIKSFDPVSLAIIGLVKLFQFIKDAMFAADKQAVSLQRNLNLSQKEAYLLRDYFSDIKNDLETQYKLTAEIINAQSELSELSSLSNLYSKEALDAQIQLTKEYKLGADESSKLNKLFILNNAQGTKGLDIALEEVAAYANQNKILFDGTKILKEISTTSGQILVSFRGSTEALTQAVLKSQKLGINLSSARDISKSLLNFEESISKELEAELLVGKDLNFERARSLALEGKFADAAEEVFKTVGGINEFEKLNVIQQEALAAAAGMTVDQLADALLTQKFIGTETGNQIKRLREAGLEEKALALARGEVTAEDLKKSLKQLDAQEKFNVAIAEAKEIFTNLVKGGILQDLADILKDIVESLGRLGYGQGAKEEKAEASVKEVKTANKEGKIKPEEIKQLESMETAVKNRTTGVGRFLLDFLDSALPGGEFRKEGRIAEDIVSQQASIKLAERTNQLLEQIAREGKNIYLDSNKLGTAQNMATTKLS
jgi:hypothetical protein